MSLEDAKAEVCGVVGEEADELDMAPELVTYTSTVVVVTSELLVVVAGNVSVMCVASTSPACAEHIPYTLCCTDVAGDEQSLRRHTKASSPSV